MNIIKIYLLTCFLAAGAFAHEALIKEHLRKLEQSSSFKANGINADFQLSPNYLQIDLFKKDECKRERSGYCPLVDVGKIELIIDASKEARVDISKLEEIKDSGYILDFAEKRENLNNFKSKIKDGNTSKILWVSLKEDFLGKNLSYPLICGALEILQNVYKTEFVFLDDSSNKPRYYAGLGFADIGENFSSGKVMFGSIAKILQSQKCMGYGAASPSENK